MSVSVVAQGVERGFRVSDNFTVADLSLFYRYYHGRCSAQLAAVIPPGANFGRHTRQANKAHPYVVKLDTPRTSLHQSSFFYRTAVRWNSLPPSSLQEGD